MREITLDARLARAFEMVPECRVCADIGADHGFLSAQLLMSSRVQRMHICDISAPSLDKARRLFAGDALESRAVFGVGDGLAPVDEPLDACVISGMGGETIVHILENCPWRRQVHLILQPMTKIPDLRLWLAQQGFGWSEQVVQEGEKFYVILSARHTGTVRILSPLEQEIGCVDWQSESVRRYAGWKQQRFQKLAQQLEQAGRAEAADWAALAQAIQEKL